MEKNQFLIYNDLIDHLYNCTGMEELKKDFMVPVRMLIPYTYCSILLAAEGIDSSSLAQAESLYQPEPVCVPGHICGSGETVHSEGGTGSGAVVDPWQ